MCSVIMCFWCDAAARGCQFSCKTAFSFTFSGFNDSSSADEDEATLTILQTSLQFLGNSFGWWWWVFDFLQMPWPINTEIVFQDKNYSLWCHERLFFIHHQPLKSDPGSKSFRQLLCSTIQLGVITSVHWRVVSEWVCVCSNTVHTGNILYVNNTLQIFYS